ncbi:IS66 family insertion sequence element accessory protein TnpB [Acidaminococcus sp. LBK-2]|uniref:IS66 family insertion sequence element accessory protein TnpB n=1 Tax=Acidaminococcus sp. LBK-2 TaxID=3456956 RepID=UPI003FA4C70E
MWVLLLLKSLREPLRQICSVRCRSSKRYSCVNPQHHCRPYLPGLWIYGYTDMRKSIDGLAAQVAARFHLDPHQPALFLFCGRRKKPVRTSSISSMRPKWKPNHRHRNLRSKSRPTNGARSRSGIGPSCWKNSP